MHTLRWLSVKRMSGHTMLLWVVCTTSQQERTQEATRELEELAAALHVTRQGASHCGSRNGGRLCCVSCRLLLEAMRTERELKEEGMEPVRLLEDTSMVDSIGSTPMTWRSEPVTELLDRVREVRAGKYMTVLSRFQNRSVDNWPVMALLEKDTYDSCGRLCSGCSRIIYEGFWVLWVGVASTPAAAPVRTLRSR